MHSSTLFAPILESLALSNSSASCSSSSLFSSSDLHSWDSQTECSPAHSPFLEDGKLCDDSAGRTNTLISDVDATPKPLHKKSLRSFDACLSHEVGYDSDREEFTKLNQMRNRGKFLTKKKGVPTHHHGLGIVHPILRDNVFDIRHVEPIEYPPTPRIFPAFSSDSPSPILPLPSPLGCYTEVSLPVLFKPRLQPQLPSDLISPMLDLPSPVISVTLFCRTEPPNPSPMIQPNVVGLGLPSVTKHIIQSDTSVIPLPRVSPKVADQSETRAQALGCFNSSTNKNKTSGLGLGLPSICHKAHLEKRAAISPDPPRPMQTPPHTRSSLNVKTNNKRTVIGLGLPSFLGHKTRSKQSSRPLEPGESENIAWPSTTPCSSSNNRRVSRGSNARSLFAPCHFPKRRLYDIPEAVTPKFKARAFMRRRSPAHSDLQSPIGAADPTIRPRAYSPLLDACKKPLLWLSSRSPTTGRQTSPVVVHPEMPRSLGLVSREIVAKMQASVLF